MHYLLTAYSEWDRPTFRISHHAHHHNRKDISDRATRKVNPASPGPAGRMRLFAAQY